MLLIRHCSWGIPASHHSQEKPRAWSLLHLCLTPLSPLFFSPNNCCFVQWDVFTCHSPFLHVWRDILADAGHCATVACESTVCTEPALFACRWVRWRWTVSSNPSVSQCSVNSSLRQWRRWICPCRAASAWGATATSGPLRRAVLRMMSAYRCGPHLPHVQPPRWGPSRAVLVSNKRNIQRGGGRGRYLSVKFHQINN